MIKDSSTNLTAITQIIDHLLKHFPCSSIAVTCISIKLILSRDTQPYIRRIDDAVNILNGYHGDAWWEPLIQELRLSLSAESQRTTHVADTTAAVDVRSEDDSEDMSRYLADIDQTIAYCYAHIDNQAVKMALDKIGSDTRSGNNLTSHKMREILSLLDAYSEEYMDMPMLRVFRRSLLSLHAAIINK